MFIVLVRPIPSIKIKEKSIRVNDCEVFLESVEESVSGNLSQVKKLLYIDGEKLSKAQIKHAILELVFQKTCKCSSTGQGLRLKKVVNAGTVKLQRKGCLCEIPLYVLPISTKHVVPAYNKLDFYPLLSVINKTVVQQDFCSEETRLVMLVLEKWLKRQYARQHGLRALFRLSALERIHDNVTNPAYAAEPNRDWLLLENSLTPDEAMQKMKERNRIDMLFFNPLYGTDLHCYNNVNFLVVNNFFGDKPPDYSRVQIPDADEWFSGEDSPEEVRELSWVEEFPAHRAAADGDVTTLSNFLHSDSCLVDVWDHDGWAPAHYACWYGRAAALKLLLNKASCDPNMCNRNNTSLLHLAAGCGHPSVVKILCDHPFIDRHILDKQGRSAVECCEQIRSKDWYKCMQLLKELAHKPYQKLMIRRMDNTEKCVELRRGSNSKVLDIMHSLNLSFESRKYFALWITSKTLHLQLKPEHSPLIEMSKWSIILQQLGGVDSDSHQDEEAVIVLKRDVRLLPNVEEMVSDILSIHLLYEEARIQVLRGLYPCSDQVAIAMAAIVMRILHGPFEAKKHKPMYFSDDVLEKLLPVCKLRMRSVNWPSKIMAEYKELSEKGPGEISQLQLLYLRYCWTQIPPYGSAFFTGYAYATKSDEMGKYQRIVPFYIGVNHRGVHFVKVESKVLLVSVGYLSMVWTLHEEKKLFQIRTEDGKVNMIIHTPQAALVCSLMAKLAHATNPI